MANNYQERCNLAIIYLAIQVGHLWDRRNFLGFGLTPPGCVDRVLWSIDPLTKATLDDRFEELDHQNRIK